MMELQKSEGSSIKSLEIKKIRAQLAKILGLSLLGLFLASGIFAAGYFFGQSRQAAFTPTAVPTLVPKVVATPTVDPTANWKLYRDEAYGFEIKYPPNIKLMDSTFDHLFGNNWLFIKEDKDKSSFSITVDKKHNFLKEVSFWPHDVEIEDLEEVLIGKNSYKAKKFSYKGPMHEGMGEELDFDEYFIEYSGNLFKIFFDKSGSLDELEFKQILSTLDFFGQDEEKKNLHEAQYVLQSYFYLLNARSYERATEHHGSGYGYLVDWNPSMDPSNHSMLLMRGCLYNGLQCLKIKEVLTKKMISPTEFSFTVQFENDDGTLFKRGPCCGATEEEMPTQTDFEFKIKKEGEKYLVVTQPIHVP